ncbi:nuclear receptor-interacting protein 3-like isoform X2 [Neoarius graeffei]|nr:nuclear receptor-interacting protein 3-like isoform X2 [Neoarius graeffei]XP_060779768.1 nuclear receptor-interacting protein 3-like isoform X2 [Neoarius graeffei]
MCRMEFSTPTEVDRASICGLSVTRVICSDVITEKQPHNILQRRPLETTLSQNRLNNHSMKPPRNHIVQNHSIHTDTQEAETDLIQVICQCFGRDMMVTIDTGCTLNLRSSVSVDKLGFNAKITNNKNEDHLGPLLHNLQTIGHMKLSLVIGQTETDLLFTVVENNRMFISLGTRTLKFLKCVIDTEKQMLVLGNSVREQVRFVGKHENEVSMG